MRHNVHLKMDVLVDVSGKMGIRMNEAKMETQFFWGKVTKKL